MSVLLSELSGNVLTLTLNRPQAYNAFTRELALELQAQLDRAHTDDAVRAVVLTGAGKAFSAGQDLPELVAKNAPPIEKILQEHFNPIVQKIRACAKPIIAAVNGVAAGAGANLALSCDIVLAAESSSFIQAFTKIGLIPDSGGTWTLPRLIGRQRASALMLTGDKVSATEALSMGMVYKVYPDAEHQDAVTELATRLAAMPTRALGLTKEAIEASATSTLDAQLSLEDQLQAKAAATYDNREGVQAFLEKRRPVFRGN